MGHCRRLPSVPPVRTNRQPAEFSKRITCPHLPIRERSSNRVGRDEQLTLRCLPQFRARLQGFHAGMVSIRILKKVRRRSISRIVLCCAFSIAV